MRYMSSNEHESKMKLTIQKKTSHQRKTTQAKWRPKENNTKKDIRKMVQKEVKNQKGVSHQFDEN